MARALWALVVVSLWLPACGDQPSRDGAGSGAPTEDEHSTGDEGMSCDGSGVCPSGQVPVLEGPYGTDSCVCRWRCSPASAICPRDDRVCIQLEDEAGSMLPGEGACVPRVTVGPGEPCAPEQCSSGDVCAGYGPDTAYCRKHCDPDTLGCGLGYACTALSAYGSPAVTACLPQTSEAGEDEACDLVTGCRPGYFCVMLASGGLCRPACDPRFPTCVAAACLPVFDASMGTLGYACVRL